MMMGTRVGTSVGNTGENKGRERGQGPGFLLFGSLDTNVLPRIGRNRQVLPLLTFIQGILLQIAEANC